MDSIEFTWTALANGAIVPVLNIIGELGRKVGLAGNFLRGTVIAAGIGGTAICQWIADGNWPIGLVKGVVWTGVAMGVYASIRNTTRGG